MITFLVVIDLDVKSLHKKFSWPVLPREGETFTVVFDHLTVQCVQHIAICDTAKPRIEVSCEEPIQSEIDQLTEENGWFTSPQTALDYEAPS